MDLDAKQQVLLAFYAEYQKDKPVMENVNAKTLELDTETFNIAVDKLQSEGLISGASIARARQAPGPVFVKHVKVTPYGQEYVENKIDVKG